MPNYGTVPQSGLGSGVGPTQLQPGDSMLVNGVVTGETPTNGISSIAIQRGLGPINTPAGIVFEVQAAARTILILGTNVDTPAAWALAVGAPLSTITNEAEAIYTDAGNFLFYAAYPSAGSGTAIVIAQR